MKVKVKVRFTHYIDDLLSQRVAGYDLFYTGVGPRYRALCTCGRWNLASPCVSTLKTKKGGKLHAAQTYLVCTRFVMTDDSDGLPSV